jgi:hypothetical protein
MGPVRQQETSAGGVRCCEGAIPKPQNHGFCGDTMRKADYALLAAHIRAELDAMRQNKAACPQYVAGATDTLTYLAKRFAAQAGVNKYAFRKACGIE